MSNALNAARVLRSGLVPETDRDIFTSQIRRRVDALTEDGEMFGLVPHEEVELALLRRVLEEEDMRS